MISKHLHYHVVQYNQRNSVIRTVFTDVVVHKIENVILHSLLFLFVHKLFNKFDANRLIQLQQIFQNCKFFIIDEKFMLKFRFLFKINSKFRIICVEFEKHFDDMNLLFCDNFVQLFFVENIFLYFQFCYMIFDF